MAETNVFSVPGISCDHCAAAITEQVEPVEGVESVNVDVAAKQVTVTGGDRDQIVAAIDEAGYDVAEATT